MSGHSRRSLALAFAFGLALLSLGGCGDSESPKLLPTPTALPSTSTPEQVAPAGDPGVTVESAIQACREKDGDRLRSFVTDAVSDDQLQALFGKGTDVRLASRTPATVEAGQATVSVRLDLRRGGELETVDRTWELERGSDGVWRFTTLPDCF